MKVGFDWTVREGSHRYQPPLPSPFFQHSTLKLSHLVAFLLPTFHISRSSLVDPSIFINYPRLVSRGDHSHSIELQITEGLTRIFFNSTGVWFVSIKFGEWLKTSHRQKSGLKVGGHRFPPLNRSPRYSLVKLIQSSKEHRIISRRKNNSSLSSLG